MKKIMKFLAIFALVLALAGETVLLLRSHARYLSAQRQTYANELSEEIVTLSASLRLGETARFDETLEKYYSSEEKIEPFLTSEEKEKLASYSAALGASERRQLLKQNELYIKLNTALKDYDKVSEAESVLKEVEDQAELKKLKETLHKLDGCKVYCSSENYREIEAELKSEAESLKQATDNLEQENIERLGSEAMLAWLDMLK